jgi:5-methylcytosine-specific restriction endonuclease McrA
MATGVGVSLYNRAAYRRMVAAVQHLGPRCWLCGRAGADTLDHVVPVAYGGTNTPANLRPAHKSCNSRRGATMPRPRRHDRSRQL